MSGSTYDGMLAMKCRFVCLKVCPVWQCGPPGTLVPQRMPPVSQEHYVGIHHDGLIKNPQDALRVQSRGRWPARARSLSLSLILSHSRDYLNLLPECCSPVSSIVGTDAANSLGVDVWSAPRRVNGNNGKLFNGHFFASTYDQRTSLNRAPATFRALSLPLS